MNIKHGCLFLFSLILISACKIDMITDVYLRDIEDVALKNAEGLKTSGLLQVGVPNCDDKEQLSQVTSLLRDYFLKVTEKSCESGMESLLTIGVDVPIIHSENRWTSKTKSTTALITQQSKDGSSILVNFALNKTRFGNLNKAIESQYFQKLSFDESTVSFSINNDARQDEGLIVSDSFVDGKPVVFPKSLTLSRRNKIDLEPSNVRRINFSEQGMMPVFEIPIVNIQKALQKAKKNKNWKIVFELRKLLAEEGHAQEQFNLGWMYEQGQVAQHDHKEAIKWFHLSAEQGNLDAQKWLGFYYCEGKEVAKDQKEKVKWCRIAAELGNADAQYKLAEMYDEGLGVPQDYKEAFKWYSFAAEQQDNIISLDAQYLLGDKYVMGLGILKNYVLAHMWFSICGSSGDSLCVKKRNELEKIMTPSQTQEAQRLARNWKPKK